VEQLADFTDDGIFGVDIETVKRDILALHACTKVTMDSSVSQGTEVTDLGVVVDESAALGISRRRGRVTRSSVIYQYLKS
jgi:hypothetical protein